MTSLWIMGAARQNAVVGSSRVEINNNVVEKPAEFMLSPLSQAIGLRQATTETPTITHTATTSSTPTVSSTVIASPTPTGLATDTATSTITTTATNGYTHTPTTSPTAANIMTDTPTTASPSLPSPSATLTPPRTESPTPESLSSIVPVTASLVPLPEITFQFPQTTGTVYLLAMKHPTDSPDLVKGSGLIAWEKLLRWWPLLVILGLWLVLGFWFVLSQGYLERDG